MFVRIEVVDCSIQKPSSIVTSVFSSLIDLCTHKLFSMSPIRGDVKKKVISLLSEGEEPLLRLASSPISIRRRSSRRVLQTRLNQSTFALGSSMNVTSFDALGPVSFASRNGVGFKPTMVLFETQGLQLSLVMRGGIWCIGRLGTK